MSADQSIRAGAWIPAGMAPTPEMLTAGRKAVWISVEDPGEFNLTENEAAAVWAAMLAAAPAVSAPAGDAQQINQELLAVLKRWHEAEYGFGAHPEKHEIEAAIAAATSFQAPGAAPE